MRFLYILAASAAIVVALPVEDQNHITTKKHSSAFQFSTIPEKPDNSEVETAPASIRGPASGASLKEESLLNIILRLLLVGYHEDNRSCICAGGAVCCPGSTGMDCSYGSC